MKITALRALALSAIFCAGACASFDPAPAAEVSPRPECAEARVTIYFTEESATLQPLSQPLLRDLMDRVGVCTNAGGELRQITIVAHPDRDASRSQAAAEMRARAARVSGALVELGAPADRIRTQRPRGEGRPMMQRRAEIIVSMW